MVTTTHIVAKNTHSPTHVRHSLSQVQAISIFAGLVSLTSSWIIKRQESYDGQLILVITCAFDDATLVVDCDAKGLLVDVMIGDELHPSDVRYSSIETAVRAIKAMASDSPTFAGQEKTARHHQDQ